MRRVAPIKLMILTAVVAVMVAAARALRGEPAPVFAGDARALDPRVLGPSPTPPAPEGPDSDPAQQEPPRPTADDAEGAEDPTGAPGSVEPPPEHPPVEPSERPAAPGPAPAPAPAAANPPGERWVFPVDDACPDGHPIKAKLRSGLYHLPGMQAYHRTKPDRCYATEVDAEADGLRRAKR